MEGAGQEPPPIPFSHPIHTSPGGEELQSWAPLPLPNRQPPGAHLEAAGNPPGPAGPPAPPHAPATPPRGPQHQPGLGAAREAPAALGEVEGRGRLPHLVAAREEAVAGQGRWVGLIPALPTLQTTTSSSLFTHTHTYTHTYTRTHASAQPSAHKHVSDCPASCIFPAADRPPAAIYPSWWGDGSGLPPPPPLEPKPRPEEPSRSRQQPRLAYTVQPEAVRFYVIGEDRSHALSSALPFSF